MRTCKTSRNLRETQIILKRTEYVLAHYLLTTGILFILGGISTVNSGIIKLASAFLSIILEILFTTYSIKKFTRYKRAYNLHFWITYLTLTIHISSTGLLILSNATRSIILIWLCTFLVISILSLIAGNLILSQGGNEGKQYKNAWYISKSRGTRKGTESDLLIDRDFFVFMGNSLTLYSPRLIQKRKFTLSEVFNEMEVAEAREKLEESQEQIEQLQNET